MEKFSAQQHDNIRVPLSWGRLTLWKGNRSASVSFCQQTGLKEVPEAETGTSLTFFVEVCRFTDSHHRKVPGLITVQDRERLCEAKIKIHTLEEIECTP